MPLPGGSAGGFDVRVRSPVSDPARSSVAEPLIFACAHISLGKACTPCPIRVVPVRRAPQLAAKKRLLCGRLGSQARGVRGGRPHVLSRGDISPGRHSSTDRRDTYIRRVARLFGGLTSISLSSRSTEVQRDLFVMSFMAPGDWIAPTSSFCAGGRTNPTAYAHVEQVSMPSQRAPEDDTHILTYLKLSVKHGDVVNVPIFGSGNWSIRQR